MKLTVEVRTELFARHSEKKWTAKAFIAGVAVIEREYNPVLAAPDKPFPLKLALQIARDARDELAKIEGFEFIFTTGEVGPDFVTFEAPDRGMKPVDQSRMNDLMRDSLRTRGVSE